jgi:chaperonin GroEL
MKYSTHIKGLKARNKLLSGARQVYEPVSTTLGARGRNVVINKGYETLVLHDGVKIAREINPQDSYELAGATILKEAAEKQVASAGDGTTLVSILGYSIAKEAKKLVDSGINPMALRKGLEKSVTLIHEKLDELSKEVKTEQEKTHVATVSSADPVLGEMIGSTLHTIGLDGVLLADGTKQSETTLEHEEGIQFDGGYFAPYWFITDQTDLTATLRDTHILVTDKEIDNIYEILPFLEDIGKQVKSLTIISPEVKGTALQSFIATKVQGKMSLVAIKAPSFGNYQKDFLQDIAVMTGATFISNDSGMQFKDAKFEDLGFA